MRAAILAGQCHFANSYRSRPAELPIFTAAELASVREQIDDFTNTAAAGSYLKSWSDPLRAALTLSAQPLVPGFVIPAQSPGLAKAGTGIQSGENWIPAFAGMTINLKFKV